MSTNNTIKISPSKRGSFTAAATKRGLVVQEFANKVLANPGNYSEAMRKKAQFAKNATKFSHESGGDVLPEYGLGGDIFGGAVSGASAGATFGPWGAGIGGALGIVSGIFSNKAKKEAEEQQRRLLEHQNSVQRGMAKLAAEEPRQTYSAVFEGGGEVGLPSDNWTRNWYNQRENVLQQNIDEGQHGLPNYLPKPTAQGALATMGHKLDSVNYWTGNKDAWVDYTGLSDAWRSDNVRGGYNIPTNSIYANNPLTLSHEEAHASGIQQLVNPAILNRVGKYKSQADAYFGNYADKAQAERYRNAMLKPEEIQSKLMEIRKEYNVDPTKPVTKEQLKNIRSEENLKGNSTNYLWEIYNDDAMLDYLNNTAMGKQNNKVMLEGGGEIKSARIGNSIRNFKNASIPNWDSMPVVQDPLYNNKMLSRYLKDPNLQVKASGRITPGSEAEQYIRGKWEYPYSSYSTVVDKATGATNYYPTLTEQELGDLAKSTGRTMYEKGGKVKDIKSKYKGKEDNDIQMPDAAYGKYYGTAKGYISAGKKAFNAAAQSSKTLPAVTTLVDIADIAATAGKPHEQAARYRAAEEAGMLSNYDATNRINSLMYEVGGNIQGLPVQGVELEGGESVVMPDGSNMNVNGPSHEQGGVPMELPETTRVFSDKIKVPGTKMTFSDENKKLSSKINKLQSIIDNPRATRLARKTAEIMLGKLENKQNSLFEAQQVLNGNSNGESKQFAGGGEIMSMLGLLPSSTAMPNAGQLADMSHITNATAGLNENQFAGKGYGFGQGVANMFSKGNIGGTVNALATAAPIISNIGQGLFGKAEQMDPNRYANQGASAALAAMQNRTVNVDPQLTASRNAFNVANRNIALASRTRGERLAGYGATAAAKAQTDASIYANKQNIENQYRGETAQMSANLGHQQSATNMQIANINAQNRAAQRNMLSTGLSQMSQLAQTNKLMKGQQRADQMRINALEGLFPNYNIDFNTGKMTFRSTQ